jgi:aminopeptidase N
LAKPKQTMYFVGSESNDNVQIWTQGQGKYTSHWFPSFDDVNEKVVFNLNVEYNKDYQVISNGILKFKSTLMDFRFGNTNAKPMSSYY